MKRLLTRASRLSIGLSGLLLLTACASSTICPEGKSPAAQVSIANTPPQVRTPTPSLLSSWKEGPAKQTIETFVKDVTDPVSAKFVPEAERIAVFDNDGTLWVESPLYTQFMFALDRIKELSADHPEWKTKQPFKAAIENDFAALSQLSLKQLFELVMATHAGTASDEFDGIVSKWLETAKHPKFGKSYTELVYQPMMELLDYLRAAGFKTYIVSGGGIEFMRVFAQRVYGIPPQQIIGSALVGEYDDKSGTVVRKPELMFINDGPGKAVSIDRIIGRRPIMAFGNSDGDYEMLAWSTAGPGPRLAAIVHHTDEVREAAYDRESSVGKLARGLDDAEAKGWLIIDMKQDWLNVFPRP